MELTRSFSLVLRRMCSVDQSEDIWWVFPRPWDFNTVLIRCSDGSQFTPLHARRTYAHSEHLVPWEDGVVASLNRAVPRIIESDVHTARGTCIPSEQEIDLAGLLGSWQGPIPGRYSRDIVQITSRGHTNEQLPALKRRKV